MYYYIFMFTNIKKITKHIGLIVTKNNAGDKINVRIKSVNVTSLR